MFHIIHQFYDNTFLSNNFFNNFTVIKFLIYQHFSDIFPHSHYFDDLISALYERAGLSYPTNNTDANHSGAVSNPSDQHHESNPQSLLKKKPLRQTSQLLYHYRGVSFSFIIYIVIIKEVLGWASYISGPNQVYIFTTTTTHHLNKYVL